MRSNQLPVRTFTRERKGLQTGQGIVLRQVKTPISFGSPFSVFVGTVPRTLDRLLLKTPSGSR